MAATSAQAKDSDWMTDVAVHDTRVQAVVCRRCGAKIYPPGLISPHQKRHRLKDQFLEGELKKLQSVFERMR